jgi:gas vesicle protein
MSQGRQDQLGGFLTGLLLGALIGASAAFLTGPESGTKSLMRLGGKAGRRRKRGGDRWGDLSEEVRDRVGEAIDGVRRRLADR